LAQVQVRVVGPDGQDRDDAHLSKPAHPFSVIKLLDDFEAKLQS
jgi:hypothetical protein